MSLIFIAGLEHSGSTLLDLILGGHPQVVGLGELYQLLRPGSPHLAHSGDIFCSCGETMAACPFWGATLEQLRAHEHHPLPERYRLVINAARAYFGDDRLFVDASKNLAALQTVQALTDLQPRVILLLRDVRGWTVSMQDERRRQHLFNLADLWRSNPLRLPQHLLTRTAFWYFLRWYRGNRKLHTSLEASKLSWMRLGYEELCLYPEYISGLLTTFLGLEAHAGMLDIAVSHSHSVLGNRMRTQSAKRQRIFYDNRWFYRQDWLTSAWLLSPIMHYNQVNVYRHTHEYLWQA